MSDEESAEVAAYRHQLAWLLDQVSTCLRGLTASQLAWRPETPEANSPWAIGSHLVGSMGVYVLGFGCGQAVNRDREAEFRAVGENAEELIGELRGLGLKIDSALADLDPNKLNETLLPPKELWGLGEPTEISRRQALVESIRHAAIHLGELRLTRDLASRNG